MQISTNRAPPQNEARGTRPLQAAAFRLANRHKPAYFAFLAFHANRCLLEEGIDIKEKGVDALVKMTNRRLSTMENGRGNYTRVHSREVATLAWTIIVEAIKRGHPEATNIDPRYIFAGGYTHDVGKTLMPNALLFKELGIRMGRWIFSKGIKMTSVERAALDEHVRLGSEYARLFWDPAQKVELGIVRDMIGLHHVMYDGLGTAYPSYPAGLRGSELPLHARIAKTADFLSAVLPREYRPIYQQQWVKTLEHATAYAITVAGTELDPFTVSCLLTGVYEITPRQADDLVLSLRYPYDKEGHSKTDLRDLKKVKDHVVGVVEEKPEFAEMIKKRSAKRISRYVDAICTCGESFGVEIAPKFPV